MDECIVKGCTNKKWQGRFVGDLCAPCHSYITNGKIGFTNSFLGKLKHELKKKNEPVISRDDFIFYMDNMMKQSELDSSISGMISNAFDGHCGLYNNSRLWDSLIKILQKTLETDLVKFSDGWIEWFIYEKDFGRTFNPGDATSNGEELDLSTAGKLYDFLISEL